ncbi:ankyrin repeat domain-containing protein [Pseudemcibacter aquimaris]|uniref:ankyrin repeat domain-containing protein n=1 Tax=Pseudemcibacter aquimaris TaxID=2857064 RepID=UPI0020115429|nr:ankyrin repeat domain-containing protein [Pseudemcibacter aquimaris]MCC3862329.1 ankyrin repeat domain-containing protein [Pseudemcibacter aquimaris]WDU59077.1 ankyrin repeat domain-containing protein [Pseudemcibacter aquimaris]
MRDEVFKAIDVADSVALKLLLEQDANLASCRSNDGMSAVLFSLYINRPEITEVLLSYEPDLDIYDLAALGGAGQISVILATEPKSVHEYSGDGFTALHVASYFGHADVVKLLLDHGAEVDKLAMNGSDLTPLQSAVSNCNVEALKVLLEFNPDVNVKMMGGFTPLMTAYALEDEEIAELLITAGADKDAKADDGRSVADFANLSGNK